MNAADVMTLDPFVVTPRDPVWLAAEVMRDRDVGFVPVVFDRGSRRLAGVITDRDVAIRHVADAQHPTDCTVADHMSVEGLVTVGPDVAVGRVVEAMERHQVRRVVVTRMGRVVGVITQADLATRVGRTSRIGQLVAKISEPLPFGGLAGFRRRLPAAGVEDR
jgi:CBS domain-containing protein